MQPQIRPLRYPSLMDVCRPFDLLAFMLANFCRVDFGGDLLGQWPAGIRFDTGITQVSRAVDLFRFLFESAKSCLVISGEWPTATQRTGTPLFETPGIFSQPPSNLQALDISPFEDTPYRLTWTCIAPHSIKATGIFQGIAHREQEGNPKIVSRVYLLDPTAKIIMHMYDDRGLDIIASHIEAIRTLYERFDDWVLDNQRHRVAFRFGRNPFEI